MVQSIHGRKSPFRAVFPPAQQHSPSVGSCWGKRPQWYHMVKNTWVTWGQKKLPILDTLLVHIPGYSNR